MRIEQDNTSAIQLERNIKLLSTKQTRHIHVRYFYITETLKKNKGISVVYHPRTEMSSKFIQKGCKVSCSSKTGTLLWERIPKVRHYNRNRKIVKRIMMTATMIGIVNTYYTQLGIAQKRIDKGVNWNWDHSHGL